MPYNKGRHCRHTAAEQASRYNLRQGMAKVALQAKRSGKPELDCVGRPLRYANEMAQQCGTKTIEKWARGSHTVAMSGGMDFCPDCKCVPEHCDCKKRGR